MRLSASTAARSPVRADCACVFRWPRRQACICVGACAHVYPRAPGCSRATPRAKAVCARLALCLTCAFHQHFYSPPKGKTMEEVQELLVGSEVS